MGRRPDERRLNRYEDISNMERATNKAERLLQIEALLLAHPEGRAFQVWDKGNAVAI